jgi:hypothetical protein
MLTTYFHSYHPDPGDSETEDEEDPVHAAAPTSSSSDKEDPTPETVAVESGSEESSSEYEDSEEDSEEEENSEEKNSVLPKLPTHNNTENIELRQLTEDKQDDDNQDQLEREILAYIAEEEEEEERQQAARQEQLEIDLRAWCAANPWWGNEEVQPQQQPLILQQPVISQQPIISHQRATIDLTEDSGEEDANQEKTDNFVGKALLLPNPPMKRNNKSTLPKPSSHVAKTNKSKLSKTIAARLAFETVNEAINRAVGTRPARPSTNKDQTPKGQGLDSQQSASSSVKTPSAKALGKRPAESSNNEDQTSKRQRLDPQPTPSFSGFDPEEHRRIVSNKAQDLFEGKWSQLQSQHSIGGSQQAIDQSGLLKECLEMAKQHMTSMIQGGRQNELLEDDRRIQQKFEEQKRMTAQQVQQQQQQQYMQSTPAPYMSAPPQQQHIHMWAPQYQQHTSPAQYMSTPPYQQQQMHPNSAPHMSANQHQQQMQQQYMQQSHTYPAPNQLQQQQQQQQQQPLWDMFTQQDNQHILGGWEADLDLPHLNLSPF